MVPLNLAELTRLISCDQCGAAVADEFRHRDFHRTLDDLRESHLDGSW